MGSLIHIFILLYRRSSHFCSNQEYPFFLIFSKNLPAAGWSVGLVYAVCMCNEKSEIKVPRAWSAFTPLYTGIKLSFYLHITHPRNYRPGPSLTWMCCHLCHWSVSCEHYGLYGGCHVTSPLDYYNRKEMTLTRHEADPSTITFTPLGGGAPDSKESRAQLIQMSDGRQ